MQPLENEQNINPAQQITEPVLSNQNLSISNVPSPSMVQPIGTPSKATRSLVLSILGLVTFLVAPLALVLSVLGLFWGLKDKKKSQPYAMAAIVISIIAIILSLSVMTDFIGGFIDGYNQSISR